ncbi:TIGR02206 family membrane protein [Oscillochloris sp. ZM17-4]|uniref:YwaF family protein n=1 Tax=Oscillochloris sp. ZM17-4 TaxID=2866714 RepID=UPI001C73A66F|nr:TIGR02206 family membrane protein [Oscillochloris sp. ZM17-4]MBX0328044.1 TIGR02206 family membrane protein [Oscillochloris sp. ZM17-4]
MLSPYFGLDPLGPPFVLFSAQHLLGAAAVILAALTVALAAARLPPRRRAALRWGLAAFCVANWLGWDAWQLANGVWSPAYSLPLQLCTLSVPVSALMLATRSAQIYEVLYFWCLAGATQALITPDLQAAGYSFPHVRYWIFFTSHGSIYLAVAFASAAWGFRPTWRSLPRAFVATNLLLAVVGLANWLTGGNYMFIARRPEYPTLIDALGPWPWYIMSLELIAAAAFVLVYLPYAAWDRLRPADHG